MSLLEALFPATASNDYRGGRAPLVVFCLLAIVMTGRSLIHFVKADAGINSIAGLVLFTGEPDPNRAVYLFSSLWGSQQVITVLIYGVVLWRYRTLVPLMYLLLMVEVVFRMLAGSLHPLGADYFVQRPPGAVGNLPLFVLTGAMLFLSLRATRRADRPGGAAAAAA